MFVTSPGKGSHSYCFLIFHVISSHNGNNHINSAFPPKGIKQLIFLSYLFVHLEVTTSTVLITVFFIFQMTFVPEPLLPSVVY